MIVPVFLSLQTTRSRAIKHKSNQSEATKQEQETRSMIPIYILVAVSLALQTIKQF